MRCSPRLQIGTAQQFPIELPRVFRTLGHLHGRHQPVAELAETPFQQDCEAGVGQAGEGPPEDPVVEQPGQDSADARQHDQPRRTRHLAGAHEHGQVIDRQADPEGGAEPQAGQGQPFRPDVQPDAPAQTGQQSDQVGAEL